MITRIVRIEARYRNEAARRDSNYRICALLGLNAKGMIEPGSGPWYGHYWNGETHIKSPFLMQSPFAELAWELPNHNTWAGVGEPNYETNLADKEIRAGELFSCNGDTYELVVVETVLACEKIGRAA